MFKTKYHTLFSVIILLSCTLSFAQNRSGTGKIVGQITDRTTGEPLIGANVFLEGTGIGASSDFDGMYVIGKVPAGSYKIIIKYVGYESDEAEITVKPDETLQFNIALAFKVIEGEEIEITAQAEGQIQAINEQLSAKTIKNVVAAEKIQELPDQSAAAALSRLPGVSLMDGDKVVIRGMQAKLNTVMVNGIELPSTDMEDRSTNLGFISSNLLSGIEVTKVLTSDMDANAIGGVVNLKLREAPENLHFDMLTQGMYNIQDRTSDNYKFWGSLSNRFLNNKLGVFLQGSAERNNVGNDQTAASYSWIGSQAYGEADYLLDGVTFIDEENIISNAGGSLILDYQLSNGKLLLQNSFANTTNDNARYRLEPIFSTNDLTYSINRDKHNKTLMVNALQGEYTFGNIITELSLSHSFSDKNTDLRYGDPGNNFGFQSQSNPFLDETGAEITEFTQDDRRHLTPADIRNYTINPSSAQTATPSGWSVMRDEAFKQHLYNTSLDFTIPTSFTKDISGHFKLGGKYKHFTRTNDVEESYRRVGSDDYYNGVKYFIPGDTLNVNTRPITFAELRNNDYKRGEYFFEGDYNFQYVFDKDLMDEFMPAARDGWLKSRHTSRSLRNDFDGNETFTAGYLMGDFNFGPRVSLIAGGRFEHYNMDYKANFVIVTHSVDGDAKVPDTLNTTDRNDDNFFPNAQLRYKFADWGDVRLAYSQSISRPDYLAILPNVYYSAGEEAQAGNTQLKPSVSTNYDLYLSFYSNKIGLFTVGGFYKEMENPFYRTQMYFPYIERYGISFPDSAALVQAGVNPLSVPGNSTAVTSYVNNPKPAYIKGLEFEWQTNFWYLPKPFNSLVFNVNYTRIWSELDYLQLELVDSTYTIPPLPFIRHKYKTVEKYRTARLLGQGDHLLNFSLGVDYKGFSARLSFRMQDDILAYVGLRPEEDVHTRAVYRWDLAIKQKLPIDGLIIGFNGQNLFHSPTETYRTFRRTSDGPIIENEVDTIYSPRLVSLYLRYTY